MTSDAKASETEDRRQLDKELSVRSESLIVRILNLRATVDRLERELAAATSRAAAAVDAWEKEHKIRVHSESREGSFHPFCMDCAAIHKARESSHGK